MTQPRVSVIVPAHDSEDTLAETLKSLQAQTYGAWEGIIVDDGSTDSTAEIAGEFAAKDARLRLTRQRNGGEGAARNTGIAHASSDWLVLLDADDWLLPQYLEHMLGVVAATPDADVAHCGWTRVGRDGHVGSAQFAPVTQELFPDLARYNCFAIHACVVRRSLVEAVGSFDIGLKTCPDWDLWQRVARSGAKFVAVPKVLVRYRLRPNSAGTDSRQLFRDGLEVISRGHRADPRVVHPLSRYVDGMPANQAAQAKTAFMCWTAGLAIGRRETTHELLSALVGDGPVNLSPALVADALFLSVPMPQGELPSAWRDLWQPAEQAIDDFLGALENHEHAPGLALRAKSLLMGKILSTVLADSDGQRAVRNPENPAGPLVTPPLLEPVSRNWGFDRGNPVDRYYIESFLARHAADISGRVLEIGDDGYTVRFGGDRVSKRDVLHAVPGNPKATFVADLTRAEQIPTAAFDCVILTQTLQLIYDLPAALRTLRRILKPGGVLLATFPGLTRTSQTEWSGSWFWRLTPASAGRLFADVFRSQDLQLTSHGNVLAASAFLYGLSAEELTRGDLDYNDPDYDVIITVRAVNAE